MEDYGNMRAGVLSWSDWECLGPQIANEGFGGSLWVIPRDQRRSPAPPAPPPPAVCASAPDAQRNPMRSCISVRDSAAHEPEASARWPTKSSREVGRLR